MGLRCGQLAGRPHGAPRPHGGSVRTLTRQPGPDPPQRSSEARRRDGEDRRSLVPKGNHRLNPHCAPRGDE
jgi:hypothetical protein